MIEITRKQIIKLAKDNDYHLGNGKKEWFAAIDDIMKHNVSKGATIEQVKTIMVDLDNYMSNESPY